MRRWFGPVQLHKGGHQIQRRGQSRGAVLGARGGADDEGEVDEVLVVEHVVLAPVAVLAQQVAVVGRQHDDGVLPHIQRVHPVEQLAEPDIRHGQGAGVALADVLDRFRLLRDGLVLGPVEVVAVVPLVVVELAVFAGTGEWFVGVEDFKVKVPVVLLVVVVEEFQRADETLRCRIVLVALAVAELPVYPVGGAVLALVRRRFGRLDEGVPLVPRLASLKFVGIEAGV